MSYSRLEKFIYAICSMDVTDLPVPLSRIEKLWNCLITGETPDFEPLSRNEKYLMAMLDRYDISNLPAPMSRGEKLLYKIAVGETDLSDVPGYLSRYEELLKYLIENGGISGGDFEYVLYTLNQSLYTLYATAEKPVKGAILSGQTLVNIVQNQFPVTTWWDNTGNNSYFKDSETAKLFKPDTDYLFIFEGADTITLLTGVSAFFTTNDNDISSKKLKLRTLSELTSKTLTPHFKSSVGGALSAEEKASIRFMIIEYQDGMENWDIPYFEGMQSVKMPVLKTTGKNLFDKNSIIVDGYIISDGRLVYETGDNRNASDFIKVETNSIYSISGIKNSAINGGRTHQYVGMYDKNKNFISSATIHCLNDSATFTTTENTKYIRVTVRNDDINRLQIEKGTTVTTYEPHKSTTLSTPSDVELRGIGDVKDELNLLTGELTERIGEIVLDENVVGNDGAVQGTMKRFDIKLDKQISQKIISDKLPIGKWNFDISINTTYEFIACYNPTTIILGIESSKLSTQDLNGLRLYLHQNPITLQYQLATESIKTVDLTVQDQNGNETNLGTFDDTTHVLLESEGLIPEAALTVRTKIPSASSTSLLMDDISTKQERLNTTVDEQSENVDATMIATTEIFEETL